LRILEITSTVAGAVCGRLFAGLGHDVILAESPGGPGLRARGPFTADGLSLMHAALNADKRCMLGLTDEGLTAGALALLGQADILLLDLVPSRAETLGLGPAHLHATQPDLVVVSVTGFGLDTALSDLPSDSLLAESYGGLSTMIGQAGRRPLSLGGDQAAYCAGVTSFLGALLAVMRRDQGYGGDLVDVAMCDVAAYMDWKSDVSYFMGGHAPARAPASEGDWRLVRCSDGWVGLIFLARHWQAVVDLIGDEALRAADLADDRVRTRSPERWWPIVERWMAVRSSETVYEQAQRHGLPFGWVVRMSDVVASAQLQQRGFIAPAGSTRRGTGAAGVSPAIGSPMGSGSLAWRSGPAPPLPHRSSLTWHEREDPGPAAPVRSGALPLEGVVVLDFGTLTGGAAVTRILADHGATVLKIESVDRPDTFRTWKLSPAELVESAGGGQSRTSSYFLSNNVGKRDIAINLKTDEGRELVRRLARHAHVVVENFRVGVTERLGIDEPSLRAVNPDLIYLSMSSQGQHGPEAANRSFGSTLDLLSGLASVTGYEDGRPLWSSYDVNYPDQLVSLMGAAAVVYCLRQRLTDMHLDVSQREVVTWTLATEVADYLANGRDSAVTGNRRMGSTPRDVYPAREPDSWIAVACSSDEHRTALARWLGQSELGDRDERWWSEHADEVDQAISLRTASADRDELAIELQAAGVPAVPVLTAADRATMGRFVTRQIAFATEGAPVKGFPMTFADYRPAQNLTAPAVGEDTREVLSELGGLATAELRRLANSGVLYCFPGHISLRRTANSG